MSSLLKALKQQQSPLLKNKSVLDSSLIAQDRERTSRLWLIWPLALILGSVTGYAAVLWSGAPGTDAKVTASDFSWGEAVSPPEVSWEATPTEPEPSQASTSNKVEPQAQAQQPTESQREALDLSSVSPELLSRFQDAVEQTGGGTESKVSVVPSLFDLSSAFQRQVPEFSYDSHMYRSRSSDRWIELNGQRLYEGDSYQSLNVIRIEPHQVVLALDSKAFSHPALEDWKR
ncbi:general secretion pathway protein GspB [Idiomarina sp.]|jgi:general secretion pathway protein B|uniref:general secretion pathway protein GspB n=1 Tax=Idiomarina sp. TaxID=1874361 RepID=UPI001DAA49E0|nr:general secretion pathway protein GspB [Idiomarina sp.]MCJ8316922.1 general secretion pathway protein GspB [Idiomarina sp.]NQZ16612.1 general secretion pathway protein GspB [Idiomarina sp.]